MPHKPRRISGGCGFSSSRALNRLSEGVWGPLLHGQVGPWNWLGKHFSLIMFGHVSDISIVPKSCEKTWPPPPRSFLIEPRLSNCREGTEEARSKICSRCTRCQLRVVDPLLVENQRDTTASDEGVEAANAEHLRFSTMQRDQVTETASLEEGTGTPWRAGPLADLAGLQYGFVPRGGNCRPASHQSIIDASVPSPNPVKIYHH